MTTLAAASRLVDIRGESATSVVDEIHIFFRFVDGRVSLSLLRLLTLNINQSTMMADEGVELIHMLCHCAVQSKSLSSVFLLFAG